MSKQKSRTTQKSNKNRSVFIGAAIVMFIALAGLFLWRITSTASIEHITPAQYQQQFASAATPHLLIDVRTPQEFASGHIAEAINIPVETIATRLNEIPHDKPVVVYCHSGNRSAQAASILSGAGYTNIYDMGGILAWTAAGLPVVQ